MEERRRQRRQQSRVGLARWRAIMERDATLAARLAGTVASVVAAGAVAFLALPLLVAADYAAPLGWMLGGGVIVLLLILAGTLLARRRAVTEWAAASLRARIGVFILTLGLLVGGAVGADRPVVIATVLAAIAAALVAASGFAAHGFAETVVMRAAQAQRQAWYAQIRASRLTRRMLGYAAYRQLRRDGALPVPSGLHPKRTYLVPIRTTPSGARILVLDGERPIGGLCLRPRQPLPDPEEALAHIMAIRTDERAWLDRANFFPQDRALTPQALGLAPGRPGNYER